MSTPRMIRRSVLAATVGRHRTLTDDPFVLLDVGASGGIEDYWRCLQPDLVAYGFDPLVTECQRLNEGEPDQRIRYFPYFVVDESPESPAREAAGPAAEVVALDPFRRASAARAQKVLSMSFVHRFNNNDPNVVLTKDRISLDRFCREKQVKAVDFIKVDTDGHDYEVLCGARELLATGGVLGLFVESPFHGVNHPHANLFSNIDRLLRDAGYSLFDLEAHRYSRAVLPSRFVYDIPAQTRLGQVVWGDALYLCDPFLPAVQEKWAGLSDVKLLKLAFLYELFGMPDCAAELLIRCRSRLETKLDVSAVLDGLARGIDRVAMDYEDLNRRFDADPQSFFPRAVHGLKSKLRARWQRTKRKLRHGKY